MLQRTCRLVRARAHVPDSAVRTHSLVVVLLRLRGWRRGTGSFVSLVRVKDTEDGIEAVADLQQRREEVRTCHLLVITLGGEGFKCVPRPEERISCHTTRTRHRISNTPWPLSRCVLVSILPQANKQHVYGVRGGGGSESYLSTSQTAHT